MENKWFYELTRFVNLTRCYWMIVILAVPISMRCFPEQKSLTEDEKLRELRMIVEDAHIQQTDPDQVVKAINELGRIGNSTSIEILVKLLTFRRPLYEPNDGTYTEIHVVTLGYIYPAVDALAAIWESSFPAMIKVIETHESNSLEAKNAVEVIKFLSRDYPPAYYGRLREAAAKASTHKVADRLLKAASIIKEFYSF